MPVSSMAENPLLHVVTVVVIDDNIDAADALSEVLASCGYEVLTAYGARAGLRLVEDFAPQAVVSDLEMPEMSGLEEAEIIRAMPLKRQPRLVAVTGAADAEMQRRAQKAGFDFFLGKPTALPDLLNALRA